MTITDDPKKESDELEGIPPFLRRKESEAQMKLPEVAKAPADVGSGTAELELEKPVQPKLNGNTEPVKKQATTEPKKAKAAKPEKTAKPATKKAAEKTPAKKAVAKKAAPKAAKTARVAVDNVDQFGLRIGSIRSKAAAMYASRKGATLAEVKEATGSVQYNVLNELENKGFKIDRTDEAGIANRPATRYKLHPKK